MDVRPFNRNISLTQSFHPGYSLVNFSFERFAAGVNGKSSKCSRNIKANGREGLGKSKTGQLRL